MVRSTPTTKPSLPRGANLTAGTTYEIYVFGLDDFFPPPGVTQDVTITGAGQPVTFQQESWEKLLVDDANEFEQYRRLESYANPFERMPPARSLSKLTRQVSTMSFSVA